MDNGAVVLADAPIQNSPSVTGHRWAPLLYKTDPGSVALPSAYLVIHNPVIRSGSLGEANSTVYSIHNEPVAEDAVQVTCMPKATESGGKSGMTSPVTPVEGELICVHVLYQRCFIAW